MPEWVPFAGLTAVVLVLLLALARASQGVVRDETPQLPAGPEPDPPQFSPEPDADLRGDPHTEPEAPATTARTELTTSALLANVALTQGLFGGVVLAGAFFYDIPGSALGVTGGPWNLGTPAVGLGVGFGLAVWAASEASASVADTLGAGYDEGLREALAPDTTRGWVVLLGAVLPTIAFVEELLFRAAVVGAPAAGFGVSPWALAVVSAAVFAVGHGAQGRVGIVVTGGLGFVLAAGFVLTGSLLVVVVAHYVVNAMEFLVHEWLGLERLV